MHQGAADGSTVLTKQYALSEIPVFVKAGAVIPTRPIVTGDTIGKAEEQYDALAFTIYPGAASGGTTVYEDDAKTSAYLDGFSAWTNVSYTRTSSSIKVTISTTGAYPQLPTSRLYTVRLANCNPPTSVTVNGQPVVASRLGGPNSWRCVGAVPHGAALTRCCSATANNTAMYADDARPRLTSPRAFILAVTTGPS